VSDNKAKLSQASSAQQSNQQLQALLSKVKAGTATPQEKAMLQSLMGQSSQYSMPMPGANL